MAAHPGSAHPQHRHPNHSNIVPAEGKKTTTEAENTPARLTHRQVYRILKQKSDKPLKSHDFFTICPDLGPYWAIL
jgi:hypothetical protein